MSFRSQAFDLFERQLRSRCNHEIVVFDRRVVVELEAIIVRMQATYADTGELDTVFFHQVAQVDLDLPALAPADGNPGIRWRKFEKVGIADEHEFVLTAEFLAEFIHLRDAANTGTHYDDLCHLVPLVPDRYLVGIKIL